MNKRLKKLISVLMATIMCVCVVLVSSGDSYAAKDQFNINVTSSISANQEYYEVEIEITNSGKDFSGVAELQVQSDYYYGCVGYDTAISIPSGSTKTYTINVPASAVGSASSQPEMVVIYDTNQKKQYSEKFGGTFVSQSGILKLGILSDNADELSFFDLGGGSVEIYGQKYKISTQEITASELADSLTGLDYLIINDYDTSVLSEEQLSTIDDFVARGGCLIIGTGERGEEVLSGFDYADSFVEAKFNNNYDSPIMLNGEQKDVTFTAINYQNYSYTGQIETNTKTYGVGSIEIVGFDLSLLDEMDEAVGSAETTIRDVFTYSHYNNQYYDTLDVYTIENVQGYMEKPANMGNTALVLLIILYVALVGPIIYLILKKMNKREKMWIVIPGISLLFVFLVFLISFGVKVRGLTVKSVTIEQLGTGKADNIIFGYTPKPEAWSVDTKEEYEYGTAVTSYDYNAQEGGVAKAQLMATSNSYHLTYNATSSFETGAFVVTSKTDPTGVFDIKMNASGSSAGSKGTVVNNTGLSFDYVIVQNYNYGYQLFRNVKDGEELKVDFNTGNNYNYYGGASTLLYNEGRDEYKAGSYDAAAELAAIALTSDYVDNQYTYVIGVRESDSLTTEDEKSWHCYYSFD